MADWKDARRTDTSLMSEWQVYRMVDIDSGPWAAFQYLVRERLREDGVAVKADGGQPSEARAATSRCGSLCVADEPR